LGKLDVGNRDRSTKIPKEARRKRTREVHNEKYEAVYDERARKLTQDHKKRKKRIVSGALLEEGDGRRLKSMRGGGGSPPGGKWDGAAEVRKKRKKWWIVVGCCIVALLILIIVTAVIFSKKDDDGDASDPAAANKPKSTSSGTGSASNIPIEAKGTDLDPFTWLDTKDFNTTYTPELVGGLPVMGLSSEWDDSAQANKKVPALNEAWGPYTSRPARGVNLGGWLSIEPFITPSLFSQFDSKLGVIDEWTLTSRLGSKAKETLEKHYSTFVTEETFKEIADAGLDHVRIPFSYWAIKTYEGDPYVERVAWRYLLRGIEWARKYGLRINLDIHGLPGSQNGWNHSGRQGEIRWNNGTEGATNAARSLEIHDSLSKFFAQPRYKNIITFYGLANEPKMTELTATVVMNWTAQAYELIRGNGITANLVFGDGFMGLEKWQGELQGYDGLVLDVHQYVIFNQGQIVFTKKEKVTYACNGWTDQAEKSMNTATGYGPTMFAEWSQADTDCTTYLNNVGWGNRWTGTYDTGAELTRVLSPRCPTNAIENSEPCSCDLANSDPSTYPAKYKTFLKTFAEAQMHSFERGWGWFYWTWKTESAAQWSYKKGLEIGMLPEKAYERSYNCEGEMPDFEGLPENL
jgi:glucan 1,3-beta-glucosidase